MAGRHVTISDFEKIGSRIGSPSQIQFQEEPIGIRQEDHSLNGELPSTARPTILLDPIQRLPPEISTFIIQHALPSNGRYSPQLIDHTAVSQIWSNFLISTPVLWSEIYLNDRQPDFLATVAIFIHFSCEVALRVAIYDRPMSGWGGLSLILAPIQHRVTSLTVLETNFQVQYNSEGISRIISAISDFGIRLACPSFYHPPVRHTQSTNTSERSIKYNTWCTWCT
jgi:hypothetical protein